MPETKNLRVFVGNGDGPPETFTALACIESPDIFGGTRATFPTKTTEDTGNFKKYGLGTKEGEEISLIVHHELANPQQDILRAAADANTLAEQEVNLQFTLTEGATTQTATAPFLVKSKALQVSDPNGDGEFTTQTFVVQQNDEYTLVES